MREANFSEGGGTLYTSNPHTLKIFTPTYNLDVVLFWSVPRLNSIFVDTIDGVAEKKGDQRD